MFQFRECESTITQVILYFHHLNWKKFVNCKDIKRYVFQLGATSVLKTNTGSNSTLLNSICHLKSRSIFTVPFYFGIELAIYI